MRWSPLTAAVLLCAGCGGTPLPRHEAILEAEAGLVAPLSGEQACAVALTAERRTDTTRSKSSYDRAPFVFAPGARVRIGEATLKVFGRDGQLLGARSGASAHNDDVSDRALGFGLDDAVRCAQDERRCGYRYVRLSERYVECGASVDIAGFVTDAGFVAYDSRPLQQQVSAQTFSAFTSVMLFAMVFAGFALMFFSWLGFWIWSRT
ncbi:MAG: hypothetical protein RMA76_42820 [Deltaproteobacteria bacterium]